MHDLDRIQLEAGEYEYGALGDEHGSVAEADAAPGFGPDSRELDLASELLEVGSDQELEQFLGKLLSGAGGAAKRFAGSATGRALGAILKDAARKALPVVGQAIGDYAAPGQGDDFGRRLGAAASHLFELELEGLSDEDKEFELARRYVRWARGAAHTASKAGGLQAPPYAIARAAAAHAARRYAPGLLSVVDPASYAPVASLTGAGAHAPLTGRWVRRGHYVVVHL